jgi:hypothetical protein
MANSNPALAAAHCLAGLWFSQFDFDQVPQLDEHSPLAFQKYGMTLEGI